MARTVEGGLTSLQLKYLNRIREVLSISITLLGQAILHCMEQQFT